MTNEPNFSANSNRLPPQNIEAEEAILGGILLDPEAIGRVAELLQAENFAVQAHQIIYHATLTLHLQGKPTDLMTVTSWLADQNQLEKVGGQGKLAQLVERTISAINIDQYSHLVVDKSIRRQLIKAGAGIMDLGYQTELELEQVLDQSEQLLLNLTQFRPQQALVPIGETLINTFQDIEDRNEGVTLPGIPCGFYDLDAMTGGFQRSDLIIVAGRPSMGKCLSQDAEIVLADGSIATIQDIYNTKTAKLLTLKPNLKFEVTQPSAFIDDGIKPVFRITTKLGRTIESTLTHPYLTQLGWQPLSSLKIGAKIAVPRIINVFGNQKLSQHQIRKIAQDLENHCIPKIIFKLERSLIAFFLNQLFTVHRSLKINSSNYKLLQQIQHLLLRFGILATLKQNKFTGHLEIVDANSIHIFSSEIVNLK
jgi:replicative DNA helicase